jgi:hypothetical protein
MALARQFSFDNTIHFFETLFLEEPLEIEWLRARPLFAQQAIFHMKFFAFILKGKLIEQIPSLLSHYLPLRDQKGYEELNWTLFPYDVWSGNLEKAEQNLMAFLKGHNAEAIAFFDTAHKMMRQALGRRNVILGPHENLCYILALFKGRDKSHHKKIQTLLDLESSTRSRAVSRALKDVLQKLEGHDNADQGSVASRYEEFDPFTGAVVALADCWLEEKDQIRVNFASAKRQFETYKNLLPLVS